MFIIILICIGTYRITIFLVQVTPTQPTCSCAKTAAGPVSRGVSPSVSCHLCGTQFRQLRVRALTVVGCWWMMSSGRYTGFTLLELWDFPQYNGKRIVSYRMSHRFPTIIITDSIMIRCDYINTMDIFHNIL